MASHLLISTRNGLSLIRARSLCLIGILLLVAGNFGCGKSPGLVPVEGTVMLKGKPVADVEVVFVPDVEQKGGRRSAGITDQDGHYTLTRDDQVPGVGVGSYKVLIFDLKEGNQGSGKKDMDEGETVQQQAPRLLRIRPMYNTAKTTPISKQVTPETRDISIELK